MEKSFSKCLLIAGMTFGFWLISLFITLIVDQRSRLSESTQREITEAWSGQQNFIGPILCVPVYSEPSKSGLPYTCMYVLPERMELNVGLESDVLHRGIFDATVYRSKLTGKGYFNLKDMQQTGFSEGSKKEIRYDWSRVQVIAAIGDKRGIEEAIKIKFGNRQVELNQYFQNYGNNDIKSIFGVAFDSSKGVWGPKYETLCQTIDLTNSLGNAMYSFDLSAELKGSSEFSVSPIGHSTVLTMHGNSEDPSFYGFMLPSDREVTDKGFSATWKISSLNRNDVAQVFYEKGEKQKFENVGTRLLVQGGQYTQTDRALKYAFLVILLSLSAVLVSEMCVKSSINVLNYLLIGAALVLFYLLLLSLSEWTGFTLGYFISAILILGMIYLYLKAILKKDMVATATASFMALIDVFIYLLLSIESMALLAGSLGLFIILGAAMYFSLKIGKAPEQTGKTPETAGKTPEQRAGV